MTKEVIHRMKASKICYTEARKPRTLIVISNNLSL